jgi:hypothetical protein
VLSRRDSEFRHLLNELHRAKAHYESITSLYLQVDATDTTAPSGDRRRSLKLIRDFREAADRYERALTALWATRKQM